MDAPPNASGLQTRSTHPQIRSAEVKTLTRDEARLRTISSQQALHDSSRARRCYLVYIPELYAISLPREQACVEDPPLACVPIPTTKAQRICRGRRARSIVRGYRPVSFARRARAAVPAATPVCRTLFRGGARTGKEGRIRPALSPLSLSVGGKKRRWLVTQLFPAGSLENER
ncbi:hypothetical protein SCP_0805560 [Sparassis crispa]|uniref:Uncharacterized protein n=1 Tax=Sparassis crispa TaxID=139825 RepID=A0A401GV02_9APHY|nr:hypothetical protein SCP_0805560 [Sparassis crispa]GBE86032.1 hypothetical protein SCP_0805560 [Sparassis crispa]